MAQPRQPKGIPVGGQYAAQAHSESGATLTDDGPGRPFPFPQLGTSEATTLADQLTFEEEVAGKLGADPLRDDSEPSWTRVADRYGVAYAEDMFHRIPSMPEAAESVGKQSWDAVTVSPEQRLRLIAAGVKPEDFSSTDRDVRMWACAERGDLVFEGKLLSSAYELSRHGCETSQRRILSMPEMVPSTDELSTRRWRDIPAPEQLAYVRGYADAVTAVQAARERTDSGDWYRATTLFDRGAIGLTGEARTMRRLGWQRAVAAEHFADSIPVGATGEAVVKVHDPDGIGWAARLGHVEHVKDISGDYFVGRVEPGERTLNREGSTTDRIPGQRVRFEIDQFLGYAPSRTNTRGLN